MKRDMGMIRTILLVLEQNHDDEPISTHMHHKGKDYERELNHHVRLLADEGLIHTVRGHTLNGDGADMPYALTWKGHDFLDNIRDENVWQGLCELEAASGHPLPSDVFLQLAKRMVRQRVGLDKPV